MTIMAACAKCRSGPKNGKQTGQHLCEREQVVRDWIALFRTAPPRNASLTFMRRALSFERQCKGTPALKRLSKAVQTELKGSLRAHRRKSASTRIAPGTHLIREWNGRTYQVEVKEDGFAMDGRSYRSLSAIAKTITGTTWSGPSFFGLRKRMPSPSRSTRTAQLARDEA
ncbi:DUF2924 domain-containing protein [Roseibium algae]|uniref:DUF2924 domain-containing protein n=1 Tax=Roseibium algae TaxID=3123038 RepID=A0ABU8TH57_9HYPH